ncbi:MAG: cell division protein SepF [Phycicoccus sp.]|nr:cell division protein SepF [Phycicoccus sp.]
MSALRKTMVYLGLAEDQRRYEDDDIDAGYEDYEDYHHAEVTELAPRRQVAEVVRSAPSAGISRITTIHPRTYNEAKTIGESFRDNVPVIMNLTDMDDADAKRLVDFAAGLVFGLHGSIERVTAKVFLLSPETVEVTGEEQPAAPARSLFNQS